MTKVYTPKYFRGLATYYEHLAKTAQDFHIPELICSRLEGAAIQFRYAAQAIEAAKRRD